MIIHKFKKVYSGKKQSKQKYYLFSFQGFLSDYRGMHLPSSERYLSLSNPTNAANTSQAHSKSFASIEHVRFRQTSDLQVRRP